MSNTTPSREQLSRALALAEQIEKLEGELASLLGFANPTSAIAAPAPSGKKRGPKPGRGKRTVSPESRARMAEAQKARWAKRHGQTPSATQAPAGSKPAKKKRQLSPEGRAKIVAALKARHAARRKEKASA